MVQGLTLKIAKDIIRKKFPEACAAYFAGSASRNEALGFSDLDLVVIMPRLDYAYRESFIYKQNLSSRTGQENLGKELDKTWPVEIFVHDPETLQYFFEKVDIPSARPVLPQMVAEGLEIINTELSRKLKRYAQELLDRGPSPFTQEDIASFRYHISGLLDDLRDQRSVSEKMATAVQLYTDLANGYFRLKNQWACSGKRIVLQLNAVDGDLNAKYQQVFREFFQNVEPGPLIDFSESLLAPWGGVLFNGFTLKAPRDWRV